MKGWSRAFQAVRVSYVHDECECAHSPCAHVCLHTEVTYEVLVQAELFDRENLGQSQPAQTHADMLPTARERRVQRVLERAARVRAQNSTVGGNHGV